MEVVRVGGLHSAVFFISPTSFAFLSSYAYLKNLPLDIRYKGFLFEVLEAAFYMPDLKGPHKEERDSIIQTIVGVVMLSRWATGALRDWEAQRAQVAAGALAPDQIRFVAAGNPHLPGELPGDVWGAEGR